MAKRRGWKPPKFSRRKRGSKKASKSLFTGKGKSASRSKGGSASVTLGQPSKRKSRAKPPNNKRGFWRDRKNAVTGREIHEFVRYPKKP